MNILCYGVSRQRQQERCEFFEGAGCHAEGATEISEVLKLAGTTHFDAVVFGNHVNAAECDTVANILRVVQPSLSTFSLAELEAKLATCDSNDSSLSSARDPLESLVAVYTQLQLRSQKPGVRVDE